MTTVADDMIVLHDGTEVRRFEGLRPATAHILGGVAVRTLVRPPGELLARFATVNDVHFGELECGMIEGVDGGPVMRPADGEPPYPVTMNHGAVAEIRAIDPAVVIAKGDLTSSGTPNEYEQFLATYAATFGDRLVHVRGNHDAYRGQSFAAGNRAVDLPGVRCLVLDTAWPQHTNGTLERDSVAWLDDSIADAARSHLPVLVFGHHHIWNPASDFRDDGYFGLVPAASEALISAFARHANVLGYFAGHTHRNRVVTVPETGPLVYAEVACVKDFPGTWAEYRIYEGGVMQVAHRVSTPEALAWSERCRALYSDFGMDYASYALGALGDRCFSLITAP